MVGCAGWSGFMACAYLGLPYELQREDIVFPTMPLSFCLLSVVSTRSDPQQDSIMLSLCIRLEKRNVTHNVSSYISDRGRRVWLFPLLAVITKPN